MPKQITLQFVTPHPGAVEARDQTRATGLGVCPREKLPGQAFPARASRAVSVGDGCADETTDGGQAQVIN
jgi:hypothetical protein